jgi:hypothetical protein
MLEDKKKLFINFAKVGIYMTQTQQLLEERESLLGNEQTDSPDHLGQNNQCCLDIET